MHRGSLKEHGLDGDFKSTRKWVKEVLVAFSDLTTGESVAIKIERQSKRAILRNEAKILNYLSKVQGNNGIPRFRWYGIMTKYNIMVTDLLGRSLETLFVQCKHQFSLKTVLMIADQCIKRLEFLHSRAIIHRDIKPDNFLVDGKFDKRIYLIDFGLSKVFKHKGVHIPLRDGKSLTGTLRYASVHTHMGLEQSRRDDLECLGYVLIYFLRSKLPWQGVRANTKDEKYQKVANLKKGTPLEEICAGLPKEFPKYLRYFRNMPFTERPDYSYIRRMFRALFTRKNYSHDFVYDWHEQAPENAYPKADATDNEIPPYNDVLLQ